MAAKQAYEMAWTLWYEEMIGMKVQPDFPAASPVLPVQQGIEAVIR